MKKSKNNKIENKIFISIVVIIIILIITNPEVAINSGREGLNLWFNVLLPALLPFFVLSHLLISLKFIDIFGSLLEPLMKPLFNVPGSGAFPFIMSIMSGYPVGAKLTSNLRLKGDISECQANRLISFASTSGPLFILGAVLIGMLKSPKLGPLMIYPHYLGSITLGLLFRRYKKSEKENINGEKRKNNNKDNEEKMKPTIGMLISSSIRDGIDSILLIGGFVIIYSVIIDLLFNSEIFNEVIILISNYIDINPDIIKGIAAGFIEMTTGCKKIASAEISLITKILICNFLIGWGGLSIHSQALSFISQTDINTKIYFISKLLHGVFSTIYTYLIYVLIYKKTITPSMKIVEFSLEAANKNNWFYIFTTSIKISISVFIFYCLLGLLINELSKKRVKRLI